MTGLGTARGITTGRFTRRDAPRDCLDAADQGLDQAPAVCDLEGLLVLLILLALLLKGRHGRWGHRRGGGGGRGRGGGGNRGGGRSGARSRRGRGDPGQRCFHGSQFRLRLALLKNGRELVPCNGVEFENKNLSGREREQTKKSFLFNRPTGLSEDRKATSPTPRELSLLLRRTTVSVSPAQGRLRRAGDWPGRQVCVRPGATP